MKAILCKEFCTPEQLVYEDVAPKEPGPGEVVVHVHACGINFPDSLIIQGKYQLKPPFPFSPGVELAGVIHKVGAGVTGLAPGMRVLGHPMSGAFAEEVVVEANRIFPIPDAMDFVDGAAFLIAYGTSYHALKDRGQLKPGETLLVLGAAGGIGLTAVELGNIMGAKVIAAASTPEKLALCKEYGAHELINYTTEDLRARIKDVTGGRGIDLIYDPVGGQFTEPALRSLAYKGRLLVLGFAGGDIPKIPLNLTLLKTVSIVGAYWGPSIDADPEQTAINMAELFAFYEQGRIRPQVQMTVPLRDAGKAITHVAGRKAMGKVVLVTELYDGKYGRGASPAR
jgi:NADPH2:quinone reductase